MYVTIYYSYTSCPNKFTSILDLEYTILDSLIGSPWKSFLLVKFIHNLLFLSRWVVHHTLKKIHYLLTNPYKTSFLWSKSPKIGLFFHSIEQNSPARPGWSVEKLYRLQMENVRNFWCLFQFLTLSVFEISCAQKSGNLKNNKNVVCLNRIPDRYVR